MELSSELIDKILQYHPDLRAISPFNQTLAIFHSLKRLKPELRKDIDDDLRALVKRRKDAYETEVMINRLVERGIDL